MTFYLGALIQQSQFDKAEEISHKVNSLQYYDQSMDMMISYYLFLYSTHIKKMNYCFKYHEKCLSKCIKTNNIKRQFNLEIIYSNYLEQIGFVEDALQINLKLLEKSKENYKYTYAVILNNTAWSYMLLHQYKDALIHYLEVINIKPDNDPLFNISWCYYQLNDYEKAKKYIHLGKKAPNRTDYYYLLLEWLDAMINKKYSQKTCDILQKILKTSKDHLTDEMRYFILIELINFYKYHHLYQEALAISESLINQNILTSTEIL